jgi:hypothetical protein
MKYAILNSSDDNTVFFDGPVNRNVDQRETLGALMNNPKLKGVLSDSIFASAIESCSCSSTDNVDFEHSHEFTLNAIENANTYRKYLTQQL